MPRLQLVNVPPAPEMKLPSTICELVADTLPVIEIPLLLEKSKVAAVKLPRTVSGAFCIIVAVRTAAPLTTTGKSVNLKLVAVSGPPTVKLDPLPCG